MIPSFNESFNDFFPTFVHNYATIKITGPERMSSMYMKKIILSCFLLFTMTACTQKEVPKMPVPAASNSIKKDPNKDYLYSSEIYTVELSDEQKSYLKKDINTIHSLIININSKDAEGVIKMMNEITENHINDIIKNHDGTIQSFIGYTGTSYESDNYISIVTTEYPYIYQSDIQPEVHQAYIFNRKDGTLISQKELLTAFHLNEQTIREQAKKAIENSGNKLCGNMPTECYQEPILYDETDNEPNTAIYVNKDNNLVMYVKKQHGLVYNWEPLILPQ